MFVVSVHKSTFWVRSTERAFTRTFLPRKDIVNVKVFHRPSPGKLHSETLSSSSLSSLSYSHETNPSRNTRELSSSVLVVSCQEEPEVPGCSSSSPVSTSTKRSTWGLQPTRSPHRRSSPRTASPSSSTPSCTTRWEYSRTFENSTQRLPTLRALWRMSTTTAAPHVFLLRPLWGIQ